MQTFLEEMKVRGVSVKLIYADVITSACLFPQVTFQLCHRNTHTDHVTHADFNGYSCFLLNPKL